jgi:hypothetical protein
MSILTIVLATVLCVVAAIGLLLRNVLRQMKEPLPDPSWLDGFNVSRYRPMQRLLSDVDYSFLAANGGSPDVIRRLRAERRRLFRAYLKNMVRDFNRLHRAARIMSLDAETDRSDFAFLLLRMRVAFGWTVTVVQFRLALNTLGLGNVDARRLLRALDEISASYASVSPARQFAGAHL